MDSRSSSARESRLSPFDRGRRASAAELRDLLPTAGPLYAAGALENPALSLADMTLLFKNRAVLPALLSKIGRDRRWTRHGEIKLGLVRHPRTPYALSRTFVPHLRWTELLEVAKDPKLPPALRRDAESLLRSRLPEMALGERIALARQAPPSLAPDLLQTPDPRVLRALLGNPRLQERDVVAIASSASCPVEVLAFLAERSPWGGRLDVRLALVRNPRTPVAAALRLTALLPKTHLTRLSRDESAPRIVRMGANRRLRTDAP